MNELALFQGAGGGTLGSKLLGWRTVCGVEIEPYCREVILRRQEEGILEPFPIWNDIRTFDGKQWRGKVDIVTGGFPCQPFSVAGKQAGESDERNMWPDTIRVIRQIQPRYCFLENVPNLLTHEYFGTILGNLAESGYDIRWRCLSAAECGAPHRRARLWILANSRYHAGGPEQGRKKEVGTEITTGSCSPGKSDLADTIINPEGPTHWKRERKRERGRQEQDRRERNEVGGDIRNRRCSWWDTDPADLPDTCEDGSQGGGEIGNAEGSLGLCDRERRDEIEDVSDTERLRELQPEGCEQDIGRWFDNQGYSEGEVLLARIFGTTESRLGRVAHGVAYRVDRLKAIGNGQVPEVVRTAWELLNNNP